MFQFLIGNVITKDLVEALKEAGLFQFLIGNVITELLEIALK